MRRFFFVMWLLLLATLVGVAETDKAAVARGQEVLVTLDEGNYAAAYKASSAMLQQAITADGWAASLKAAHKAVGARQSRKLVKATHQDQLNGMTGDFYVLHFSSSYANLPKAAELLTLIREDAKWKLAGYQIVKPEAVPAGL